MYSEDLIGLFGPSPTKTVDSTTSLLAGVTSMSHADTKDFLMDQDEFSSLLPDFDQSNHVDVNDSFFDDFSSMPIEAPIESPLLTHVDSASSSWTTDEEDAGFSSDSSSFDDAPRTKKLIDEKPCTADPVMERRHSDFTSCDEFSGDESDGIGETLSLDEHMMPEDDIKPVRKLSTPSHKTSTDNHGVFVPSRLMLQPSTRPDPRSSVILKDLDSRLRVIAAPRMDTCFENSIDAGQAVVHNPSLCDICRSNKSPYRKAALHRYRAKRANRDWRKGARYGARSAAAFTRKRHNGRFAGTVY